MEEWALLATAVGIYRSTVEGAAGGQGSGDGDDGGGAGRQGRPFPAFVMSHCNRDGSAVHCLARSEEVQVFQILFIACRVCFVVLVHKQLRCASDFIS